MHHVTVPIAVIGGGNIARAILRGSEDACVIDPSMVVVAEPSPKRRELLGGLAAHVSESATDAIAWLKRHESAQTRGQLLLAVNPPDLERVGRELRPLLGRTRRVVISLLAGTPTCRVREHLGDQCAVVRAMPNVASQVRHGVTAIACGSGAMEGDDSVAVALFSGLGLVVTIREDMMDSFTAIAGCGPGYVFMLADAMIRAAIEFGMDPAHAKRIVAETIIGSGMLLNRSRETAHELRMIVCSPGGTSAAANEVFEERQVIEGIIEGIHAARARGAELSTG